MNNNWGRITWTNKKYTYINKWGISAPVAVGIPVILVVLPSETGIGIVIPV